MHLNDGGASAPKTEIPATPSPWWKLPADFVPAEPFHPQLTIVPEHKILNRAARMCRDAGDREGATDLLFAYARAIHPFQDILRKDIQIQIVPGSTQPATVMITDLSGGAA